MKDKMIFLSATVVLVVISYATSIKHGNENLIPGPHFSKPTETTEPQKPSKNIPNASSSQAIAAVERAETSASPKYENATQRVDHINARLPHEENTEHEKMLNYTRHSLDARLAAESYDPEWAPKIENDTWEEFYAIDLPRSDIENIECRTTLCKIAVVHEDIEAEANFQKALLTNTNGRGGYFENVTRENGVRLTLLYRYR